MGLIAWLEGLAAAYLSLQYEVSGKGRAVFERQLVLPIPFLCLGLEPPLLDFIPFGRPEISIVSLDQFLVTMSGCDKLSGRSLPYSYSFPPACGIPSPRSLR